MQAVQTTSPELGIESTSTETLSSERWLVGAHIAVALTALLLGLLMGPFQTFRRAPMISEETLGTAIGGVLNHTPIFTYYYQALTLHGVLNALVFTTFFIMGFSYFTVQRSLKRPIFDSRVSWASFWMMFVGLLLAAFAIITGQANVLFTFYPPMIAHPTFYLGLALVIVGSWVGAAGVFITYNQWREDHPGEAVPLAVYALLANFLMWISASLGVAIEVVFMLLPLSLGLVRTTDPQLARVFFWFFGHPLVYFWLIPAYASWYTMLPKQLGVKLFSDPVGRLAFLMIAILSIPIGVHHLFVDPGVSEVAKAMHSFLTLIVAIPSLLTAFNIAATLEMGTRKREGKENRGFIDTISWMWKQPWGNPLIAAQICGMLLFIVGGITGIMNASFTFNVAIHNTTWIVAHFHMTLAGAVFLTYIGISYWLVPMLRGRKLFSRRWALIQIYTWFFGMIIFGTGYGRAGLEGATRRTDLGAANYINPDIVGLMNIGAIGGAILLVSIIALYVNYVGTLFFSKEPYDAKEAPISTEAPKSAPLFFERWQLWVAIIIITNIIMWGPVMLEALNFTTGFQIFGYDPAIPLPIR